MWNYYTTIIKINCNMNIKFLDKVYDQILSETRIIDDKGLIHFPFILPYLRLNDNKDNFFFPLINQRFYPHCKDVYSLNKEETDYMWGKYKEGITTLINDKDTSHQEKRMMIHNSRS